MEEKRISIDALETYQIYENDVIIFNSSHSFDTKVKYNNLKKQGRNVQLVSRDIEMDVSQL